MRRDHLDEFIDYYLACLKKEIDGKIPMPFTADQLKVGYQRLFVLAGFLVLPLFAGYMHKMVATKDDTNFATQKQKMLDRAKYLMIDIIAMDKTNCDRETVVLPN